MRVVSWSKRVGRLPAGGALFWISRLATVFILNKSGLGWRRREPSGHRGFSLEEVVFSMGIASVAIGGLVSGHSFATGRTLWSAASMAAQSAAVQRMEQSRSAKWDPLAYPPVDEFVPANFAVQVTSLAVPGSDKGPMLATNFTTISVVSAEPLLKMIRVDTTWAFLGRGVFTNTVFTYRSPDQ